MIFREDFYCVYVPESDGFLGRDYRVEQDLAVGEVYMFSLDQLDDFMKNGLKRDTSMLVHGLGDVVFVPVHESTIDGSLFPLYDEGWYFNMEGVGEL